MDLFLQREFPVATILGSVLHLRDHGFLIAASSCKTRSQHVLHGQHDFSDEFRAVICDGRRSE